jgi:MFS family permease
MSFLVPTILLSALAGVIVDRLDVRMALIVPNTVRTLLTIGLAAAGTNVALLLILNLGVSLTTVVLTPAEGSMIPRIVPKPQLGTAMGIFNLTLQGSFAVGFAFLGPILVTVAGPSTVLGVVAIFYAAATLVTLRLPAAPPVRGEDDPAAPRTLGERVRDLLGRLAEGLAAVGRNREVARPLLHLATSASLVGVIGVVGPAVATELGLDPKDLIVVVLPLGLGVVAGVVALSRFGQDVPLRRASEIGLLGFGVLGLALASVSSLGRTRNLEVIPLVIGLALVAGGAYAMTTVSSQTALLENIGAGVRGRVFGVLASIVSTASLVPIIVAGPLADRTSGPVVVAISAAAVLIVAVWSAVLFGPRKNAA